MFSSLFSPSSPFALVFNLLGALPVVNGFGALEFCACFELLEVRVSCFLSAERA